MPTEIIDLIDAATVAEKGGRVKSATRSVLVTGVDPGAYANPGNLTGYDPVFNPGAHFVAAYQALSVDQGDRHPTYPFLFCAERNATLVDPGNVRIDLLYKPLEFNEAEPDPPPGDDYVLSGEASLEEGDTFVDKDGNPIELSFNDGTNQYLTVAVSVPIEEDRRVLEYGRRVLTSTPGSIADDLIGKVNNATWNGKPAGEWKCRRVAFQLVNGESDNGAGGTLPLYSMRFVFAHKPGGWDPQIVYTDPETGNPIRGWETDTNASATVPIHDAVNFQTLLP